jgi:flagellar biosynthesis chaperone FliJ
MTTFAFRLERVLRWRQAKLELEQFALSRLAAECTRWDLTLAGFESTRASEEALVLSRNTVTGEEFGALDRYRKHLQQQKQIALDRRQAAGLKMEEQRGRVMKARRESRLLEKLRDVRRKDWEETVNREFESLAAETYLARWSLAKSRTTSGPAAPGPNRP